MKILVVDDHATNRALLRAQLETREHVVLDAEDGFAALEILEREPVAAIVSDILMPRMDGYRLCFEVRRRAHLREVPFIFYTATYNSPNDEKLALDLGADGYVRKPASVETICAALSFALRRTGRQRPGLELNETDVLKEYSERLVSKLEEKNAELQAQAEALRDSDYRLRAILATCPECVKVLDADGSVLEMNPAGLRMIEADSFLEVERLCLFPLIVEEDREHFRTLMGKVFAGTSGVLEFEIVGLKGGRHHLETHASPLRDATGKVTALIGITRDITERKRIEEQLRQARNLEAIGQLAGGVAHDFNNILSAIIGNADLALANLAAGHAVIENLEAIGHASNRARDLVRQILTFSRRQAAVRSVVALGPLVEEAASLLRATLPAGVDLVRTIAGDAPNVLADPTQIHQILFNLCTNAWHALGNQPGCIEICLSAVTFGSDDPDKPVALRPGPSACLAVRDTGSGMDAQTLEHIFEPFFTTKPPGEGTGLGLSVVHGIAQSHDGAVAVTSKPGAGTTFRLYFPAVDAELTAHSPAPSAPAECRGSGQHILYLDDEEPLVLLARRMLAQLGYRVTGFSHSADALQALRASPADFDLVVTDMNMPGPSGLNVAQEVHKIRPGLAVVLISGHVTDELKQQADRAGIRHVLYKPTSMLEFREVLHQLMAAECETCHSDADE